MVLPPTNVRNAGGRNIRGVAAQSVWQQSVGELYRSFRVGSALKEGSLLRGLRDCERSGQGAVACELLETLLPDRWNHLSKFRNLVLGACKRGAVWDLAIAILASMDEAKQKVDLRTHNAVLTSCARAEQWEAALDILSSIPSRQLLPDIMSFGATIGACGRGKRLWRRALQLFDDLIANFLQPDAVVFNSVISSCKHGRQWQAALWLIDDMAARGLEPDVITHDTVINACEGAREVRTVVQLARRIAMGHTNEADSGPGTQALPLGSPGAKDPTRSGTVSLRGSAAPATEGLHVPVLLQEVVDAVSALDLPEGSLIVDCTLGDGGHAEAILDTLPGCRLLGIDRDTEILQRARRRLSRFGEDRVELVHGNFATVSELVTTHGFGEKGASVLLADLGVSSFQLDTADRGFSFTRSAPLDMRMDPTDPEAHPARWYIEHLSAAELAKHLSVYGEEPLADKIAARLVEAKPQTTVEASRIIEGCVPRSGRGIHPATKTFQALRILVNGELDSLDTFLKESGSVLQPGGLLCVLTFQGLEDDRLKRFLRGGFTARCASGTRDFVPAGSAYGLRPSFEEMKQNPRARSGRLRMAVRSRTRVDR